MPTLPSPTCLGFVIVNGRRVRYRALDAGPAPTGRPLLLLHGLGCSSDAWLPTLDCLERREPGRLVIAPDMPGYGHSHGPPEALGMEDLADWAARFLDTFGIHCAHVAGGSMGCQVGLDLARRHPARVGSLVLVGPTTGEHFVPFRRYLRGLLLDGLREPMRYNLLLMRMYRQMGLPRYLATTKKMLEEDPVARPEAIRAPCLIVRGEWDAIVSERVARQLAAILPRGTFCSIEGVAHALQFSAPERFIEAALPFLREADAALCPSE